MATWRLLKVGVLDEDTSEWITRVHVRWQEYVAFREAGGVPLPYVPEIVPDPPLADVQEEVIDLIDDWGQRLRARAARGIGPQEAVLIMEKVRQAKAAQASGNPADAPLLVREANRRGISLATLVTKILNKASVWADFEADVAGASGAHADAVRALTTVAAVRAYDWQATLWPSLP